MASYLDWKVGDRVVCITDGIRSAYAFERNPVAGKTYTIREISSGIHHGKMVVGIRLKEIVNRQNPNRHCCSIGSSEVGFLASRFRKVEPRKTDISVFTAILHTTRVPSKAKETA